MTFLPQKNRNQEDVERKTSTAETPNPTTNLPGRPSPSDGSRRWWTLVCAEPRSQSRRPPPSPGVSAFISALRARPQAPPTSRHMGLGLVGPSQRSGPRLIDSPNTPDIMREPLGLGDLGQRGVASAHSYPSHNRGKPRTAAAAQRPSPRIPVRRDSNLGLATALAISFLNPPRLRQREKYSKPN